jgi:hypothetical protein
VCILFVNIATGRIRNLDWQNEPELKERLQTYIRQGLQNTEILSFIQRDFDCYAWIILRSLERRRKASVFQHQNN